MPLITTTKLAMSVVDCACDAIWALDISETTQSFCGLQHCTLKGVVRVEDAVHIGEALLRSQKSSAMRSSHANRTIPIRASTSPCEPGTANVVFPLDHPVAQELYHAELSQFLAGHH